MVLGAWGWYDASMRIQTKAQCPECDRVFDLLDEVDAEEFHYGHDCEESLDNH